ncbi:MAG: type II toxin-antitoxin system HipA family toxin [Candidatus Goldbacteria bacterium]|nr:type II toxin-antitoxin system HipA family toxin [Candidatus Goldiibacteriota bacterium]
MKKIDVLEVYINGRKAGRLGQSRNGVYVFEYDRVFLKNGFSISPFQLPLTPGVFTAEPQPYGGLFGVFNDSLPDGWGRLLIDRLLLKNKIDPGEVSLLERLSIVGKNGMGALEYRPENNFFKGSSRIGIKEMAKEVKKVLNENYTGHIEALVKKGGSSGGARPKAMIRIKGEPWIVKFPNSNDNTGTGVMEYEYSLAARGCGIIMPQTKLLEKKYFAIKRFDRNGGKKVHMHTAAGLLNADFRIPSLDYTDLMKAAMRLTGDIREVIKVYRLMVFNILSHNRDDHAKNFSFIYSDKKWSLSPAYDLTFSYGFNGQHTTTLFGQGLPGEKEILESADVIGIKRKEAEKILSDTADAVKRLKKYIKTQG